MANSGTGRTGPRPAYRGAMAERTPPKGRPTPGRRDRQVVRRRSRSRSNTKKFVWAVLAMVVLAAVLVIGSGTGGNGDLGT